MRVGVTAPSREALGGIRDHMTERRKPWDERLLERIQRGSDHVAGPGWARFVQGVCSVVVIALGVADLSAAWIFWGSLVGLLLVLASELLAKVRASRGRR